MLQKLSQRIIPEVKLNFPSIAEEYGALRPRPEKLIESFQLIFPFFEENDHFSPQVQRTSSRLISV